MVIQPAHITCPIVSKAKVYSNRLTYMLTCKTQLHASYTCNPVFLYHDTDWFEVWDLDNQLVLYEWIG